MTKLFLKNNFDIVTNVFPKTFPSGQSVEIIHRKCFISLSPNKLKKNFLYNKIDADSSIEEILRKWNKIK